MTHTLITFLGRTPEETRGSYRTTRYYFGDSESESLAFFGWALQRRLRPNRLVVLGTPGSMWDHLFEGDIALGDAAEEDRLALVGEAERQAVTPRRGSTASPRCWRTVWAARCACV